MNIRTRTLAGFIAKEFTQIFRDPKMIEIGRAHV